MSGDQPPRKRARSEGQIRRTTHDPDFYYEDGNIVIQCTTVTDDVDEITCFRVHRTILSQNSSVFADMLSIPTPQDVEVYEGAPLVQLPDSTEECRAFLRFIYDHNVNVFQAIEPDFAARMMGPLKLATKYDVKWLRDRIIAHLKLQWPQDLDARVAITAKMKAEKIDRNPAAVLRLCRTCDMPEIIPQAVHSLLLISNSGSPVHDLTLLTAEDYKLLYIARTRVSNWMHLSIPSPVNMTSPFCTSGSSQKCYRTFSASWLSFLQGASGTMRIVELVDDTLAYSRTLGSKAACTACTGVMDRQLHAIRTAFSTQLNSGAFLTEFNVQREN